MNSKATFTDFYFIPNLKRFTAIYFLPVNQKTVGAVQILDLYPLLGKTYQGMVPTNREIRQGDVIITRPPDGNHGGNSTQWERIIFP